MDLSNCAEVPAVVSVAALADTTATTEGSASVAATVTRLASVVMAVFKAVVPAGTRLASAAMVAAAGLKASKAMAVGAMFIAGTMAPTAVVASDLAPESTSAPVSFIFI